MKIALVYQAGIANVFRVDHFQFKQTIPINVHTRDRNARRLLQACFPEAEHFALGAMTAGAELRVYGCNMAGDVKDQEWSLDRGPFREHQRQWSHAVQPFSRDEHPEKTSG